MSEHDIDFAYWHVAPSDTRTNAPGTCLWCGKKLRQKYDSKYEHYNRSRSLCCKAPVIDGHTCEGCGNYVDSGRRLVSRTKVHERLGDYGDGAFCTLRCGYMFGVAAAKNGFRLQKLPAS